MEDYRIIKEGKIDGVDRSGRLKEQIGVEG